MRSSTFLSMCASLFAAGCALSYPALVHAYRLIGYEDRLLADAQFRDDRIDAGEIGSGHQVTALFELALSAEDVPSGALVSPGEAADEALARAVTGDELARVYVRFKQPGASEADAAEEVSAALAASELVEDVDQLEGDALWALGVASLASRLRGDARAQSLDLDALRARLSAEAGTSVERREFLALLPQVSALLAR